MRKKKTVLMIAALLSVAALSACNASTGAKTDKDAEQSTAEVAAESAKGAEATDASGEAQSARTQIGEDEWKEYYHKLFTLNQPDEIFGKHSSVLYETTNNFVPFDYNSNYTYLTADSTYMCGNGFAEYIGDRMIYMIGGLEKNGSPYMLYYVDLSEKYSGRVTWFSENEDEWVNPEIEWIADMYIEDGQIHMWTGTTDAGSKQFFEETVSGGRTYAGEKLRCEIIADANTYELSVVYFYLEKDGQLETLKRMTFTYDQAEPDAKRALCGAFERQTDLMMTVSFTARPGTDKEVTKSITIPGNSDVMPYIPDMVDPVYYTDYECTQPFAGDWDMLSDLTIYVKDGE